MLVNLVEADLMIVTLWSHNNDGCEYSHNGSTLDVEETEIQRIILQHIAKTLHHWPIYVNAPQTKDPFWTLFVKLKISKLASIARLRKILFCIRFDRRSNFTVLPVPKTKPKWLYNCPFRCLTHSIIVTIRIEQIIHIYKHTLIDSFFDVLCSLFTSWCFVGFPVLESILTIMYSELIEASIHHQEYLPIVLLWRFVGFVVLPRNCTVAKGSNLSGNKATN